MKSKAEGQEGKVQLKADTGSGMIVTGEKVVMQTAQVSIGCNDNFYKTRALLDTGSTRNYIVEDLANMPKVKPGEQQTFSFYSFGNTKAKEMMSPVV